MSVVPAGLRTKVLLASDGSAVASSALPLARVVAEQLGCTVEVLHVSTAAKLGQPELAGLRQGLSSAETLQVRAHATDPASELMAAAAEPTVSLLVITTRGAASRTRKPLGHVVESVIAHTTSPILLLRPEVAESTGAAPHPIKRLLIPFDGTPNTASALCPAFELAARLGAAVDVLYIAAPGSALTDEAGSLAGTRYVDQPQHEWLRWSDEVLERLCVGLARASAEVPTHVLLAAGNLPDTIEQFAVQHEYDALVLVRRSHLEPGRAALLRETLRRAPCPVLLVSAAEG